MLIFKGFCIGFTCLVIGGVIGHNAANFEFEVLSQGIRIGMEAGKKSVIQKK
jgi:hypothetical protein